MATTMHPQLKKLMRFNFLVKPFVSVDRYGKKVYGTQRTVKGFMQGESGLAVDGNGEEQRYGSKAFLNDDHTTIHDEITTPDGNTPQIVSVSTMYDEKGIHHQEVTFR